MDWHSRLQRLEKMLPGPVGRIPAASLTDDEIVRFLESNCEWLGLELPAHPWSDEDRAAVDAFWDETFGLGKDFRSAGFSRYQLQLSLRHSAANAGLLVSDSFEPDSHGRPDDAVDIGPYHPQAGMRYRMRLERERQQDNDQQGDTSELRF